MLASLLSLDMDFEVLLFSSLPTMQCQTDLYFFSNVDFMYEATNYRTNKSTRMHKQCLLSQNLKCPRLFKLLKWRNPSFHPP